MAVLGSCCNACFYAPPGAILAQKLNSKIGDNLPSDVAVLGSCCNACFYAPLGAIFWHVHVFTSKVSHSLHHAFHFCLIRSLRQWRRSACRSSYDPTSAILSVLGATSAAQRSAEKASLSQKKSHCQNLPTFENGLQLACITHDTCTQSPITTLS